ncbi:retropepsin-like aspartic protease [Phenylobacterium sp. J367]|uniref:retropepsin-like aspartic protease n=1 Tax=Phenylobacterium sp. J367 TaxID=2898435 RepID=UPI0021519A4C|nr:retropepsin-like aspartic protease [Phenylobacterium sp. J367]MCR5878200.1 aspartyl protease family protein [Phenylobacterium sp. J367]
MLKFRSRNVLIGVALALLVTPAQAAQAPTPAQATVAHSTYFDFLQERQVLFPMRINGRLVEAWLDSGASSTVVDARVAASLGLPLGEVVRAQGVAGRVDGVRLARADLQLGDLALPGRAVAVMDLDVLAEVVPRPVQVILGRDVFDSAVLDIDFRTREIAFLARHDFRPPPVDPLPLTTAGNLRAFPIRIGGVATPAILDLGNSGALLIDRDFADANRLLDGRAVSTQLSVGVDGPRESAVASVDKVEIGGVSFDDVPTVATVGLVARAPANVGLALLSRFHVTVDFAGDRLWLQPYPGSEEAPFRKNRAGLSVVAEGDRLRVTHVARGSPAEAAGWGGRDPDHRHRRQGHHARLRPEPAVPLGQRSGGQGGRPDPGGRQPPRAASRRLLLTLP